MLPTEAGPWGSLLLLVWVLVLEIGPGASACWAPACLLSHIPGHGKVSKGLWKVEIKEFMVIFISWLYSLCSSLEGRGLRTFLYL